jgi:phosphoribosylformylglycinamidine (FGAM) synthase-like amidotransferase family enzyme
MSVKTVTLADETLINSVESYRRHLENTSGKAVSFTRAFHIAVQQAVENLLSDNMPSAGTCNECQRLQRDLEKEKNK